MNPGDEREASQWRSVDTDSYDRRWTELEAEGHNPHGEVDVIMGLSPTSVLDAGCGTGRVAIELTRRGVEAVGVDLDQPMIDAAQTKAPELTFHRADLASVQLDRTFDVVAMAGNVMIFVAPGTEAQVIANMAAHLESNGVIIAGFQLDRGLQVEEYNRHAKAAGLTPVEHWSTWEGDPATEHDDYAVLIHRRRAR